MRASTTFETNPLRTKAGKRFFFEELVLPVTCLTEQKEYGTAQIVRSCDADR
jgi:hypothetical protein